MALYSKQEFASRCGVATNYLSVQIKRGKVVLSGELVDDSNEINAAFLQKRTAKAKILTSKPQVEVKIPSNDLIYFEDSHQKTPKVPKKESKLPMEVDSSRENLSYASLDREKKLADLLKVEADTTHRKLQIEKLQGASIPTELVKAIISTLSKSLISSFKDGADNFLIEISKRKNLNGEELASLRGALVLIINNASSKAIDESKKRLKNIVNEYSDKREVGEHD